jgi:hypothetical protein
MRHGETTLTYDEIATAKAAIRVIRFLAAVVLAVAVPLLVAVALPLVGWTLLAAVVLSPVLFVYALAVAMRQGELEREAVRR